MTQVLFTIVVVALAAAFVVLLVKKWGIAEWYQINGDGFTSRLFSCDLCMSFWAAVILLPFVAIHICGDMWILTVPVFSTPLTRLMV